MKKNSTIHRPLVIVTVLGIVLGISYSYHSCWSEAPISQSAPYHAAQDQASDKFRKLPDINQLLQNAANTNQAPWYILLLAFLAGILVSFTPCIYPMIPITAGILQGNTERSLARRFLSSFFYICGIATVYATLGYFSAKTSLAFGRWMGNPWFLLFMILFFLYLAFSLFGFYELRLPSFLSQPHTIGKQRGLLHNFVFGVISGSAASPCLTPALALLLGIVAKQANPLFGFLMLFCFALGMGILLLIVGVFSNSLYVLPNAGVWMNLVKNAFGFLMLAMCIHIAQPFISPIFVTIGYLVIASEACIFYGLKIRESKIAYIFLLLALGITLMVVLRLF